MKAKRITVVAFLLAAIMLLGVGFAAVSDQLFIHGRAYMSAGAADESFDPYVYFSAVESNATTKGTASISSNDQIQLIIGSEDGAGANKGLVGVGDSVTFTATISSTYNEELDLTAVTANGVTNLYTVEILTDHGWTNGENTMDAAANESTPATLQIAVKVTLVDLPDDLTAGQVSTDNGLKVTITATPTV